MAGAHVDIPGLVSFPYVSDQVVIVAPPDHALVAREAVSVDDLDGQAFILREPGSATRRAAERCLERHGVTVDVQMELGSNEAVRGPSPPDWAWGCCPGSR